MGGSFHESYQKSLTESSAAHEVPQEFREQWPALADVLCGIPAKGKGKFPTPSASVILFVEGDRVKFCLSPAYGPRVAFGTLADPSKGLDDLELQLAQGRFEWKVSSRRRKGGSQPTSE